MGFFAPRSSRRAPPCPFATKSNRNCAGKPKCGSELQVVGARKREGYAESAIVKSLKSNAATHRRAWLSSVAISALVFAGVLAPETACAGGGAGSAGQFGGGAAAPTQ